MATMDVDTDTINQLNIPQPATQADTVAAAAISNQIRTYIDKREAETKPPTPTNISPNSTVVSYVKSNRENAKTSRSGIIDILSSYVTIGRDTDYAPALNYPESSIVDPLSYGTIKSIFLKHNYRIHAQCAPLLRTHVPNVHLINKAANVMVNAGRNMLLPSDIILAMSDMNVKLGFMMAAIDEVKQDPTQETVNRRPLNYTSRYAKGPNTIIKTEQGVKVVGLSTPISTKMDALRKQHSIYTIRKLPKSVSQANVLPATEYNNLIKSKRRVKKEIKAKPGEYLIDGAFKTEL